MRSYFAIELTPYIDGVDILEQMISHIDVSKKTGTLLLLCAPRDNVDDDFAEAMKEHFDIDLNDVITS